MKTVIFASNAALAAALQGYLQTLPNGDKYAGAPFYWPALGHTIACSAENGYGEGFDSITMVGYHQSCGQTYEDPLNNQFANDFKASGYSWATVCPMDSDGDGQTNGEEMGDPLCTWSYGQTPCRTSVESLSLPGDDTSQVAVLTTECETAEEEEAAEEVKEVETPTDSYVGHDHGDDGHHDDGDSAVFVSVFAPLLMAIGAMFV